MKNYFKISYTNPIGNITKTKKSDAKNSLYITMIKLFCYSILIVSALTCSCYAQDNYNFQNVVPVGTVAPDAASLGKFGNIPVSYATGIPSVTIPLYQLAIGSIKIPLSLDYHGGGVRVDEVSSSVGTSWALSGIPIITRNMVGLPDERGDGYLYAPPIEDLYNYMQGTQFSPATDASYAQFVYDVRDNKKETEPDVFSYSLNGSSGKFVYRPDGTIMQIPVSNNKIERTNGNNFKITDENGIIYLFDQAERTQYISQSAIGPGTYISAWHVSKIIDKNSVDTVSFTYNGNNNDTERTWNFTYTLGKIPDECGPGSSDASGQSNSVTTIEHTELYPKEVIWRGGKITFASLLDRTDRVNNRRLDSVKVYAKANGNFQLLKNIKLYQSYFFSNPIPGKTADYRNYRLKLDSVAFLALYGLESPQKYRMTYNNSPMAPNESFAQDSWGYNNGQFSNNSMMPKQSVLWKGAYFNIGDANMDTDSIGTYIQACMLQSIQYPTKGKSVFAFEPHRYPLNYQSTKQESVYCDVTGDGIHSSNTQSFTVNASQTSFAYTASLSAYNYPGVTDRPQIKMTDQNTGQTIFLVNNVSNPSQSYSTGTIALSLTVGHSYTITTNVYTTDSRVKAYCNVSWYVPISGTLIKAGGGLRVSSVTNYDNTGVFINRQSYQYGTDGSGKLLTDASYLLVNYENTIFRHVYTSNCNANTGATPQVLFNDGGPAIIYYGKSVYPATQFVGSPVLYTSVTKFDTDINGVNPNGKTVYEYDVYGDTKAVPNFDPNFGNLGVFLISNSWLNGFIKRESAYKMTGNNYVPVNVKGFLYKVHKPETVLGLKIKPLYIKVGSMEATPATDFTRVSASWFSVAKIPTSTGAIVIQNEADTLVDNLGNKIVKAYNYYYDDLTHILPTKKELVNSKNDTEAEIFKYAHDFASNGNVYQKMLDRNIVAPVVSHQETKNGTLLKETDLNYNDWFNNGALLLPQSISEQVLPNSLEIRSSLNKYDSFGNILEQQKALGFATTYLWGYSSQYPIAEIKNASYQEIVNVLGQNAIDQLASSTSADNAQVRNLLAPLRSDSRLKNALVTVYTYNPLVGMTSQTDAKGLTTTYEYDGFQRLVNVKDQNGNIIKHNDYHYQSQ